MAKHIVGKTIAKTVIAVVIVIAIIYAVLSLLIPQHLATMYSNIGAYSAAARYASLRYTYTNDIADLDRCATYAVLSGKDKNIIQFCGELLDNEGFEEYCNAKDDSEGYRQHVYASIAGSYYSTGDTESAVSYAETAIEGLDYFPEYNAMGTLTVKVADAKDGSTAGILYAYMETWKEGNGYDPASASEAEQTYYYAVMNVLASCKGGTE